MGKFQIWNINNGLVVILCEHVTVDHTWPYVVLIIHAIWHLCHWCFFGGVGSDAVVEFRIHTSPLAIVERLLPAFRISNFLCKPLKAKRSSFNTTQDHTLHNRTWRIYLLRGLVLEGFKLMFNRLLLFFLSIRDLFCDSECYRPFSDRVERSSSLSGPCWCNWIWKKQTNWDIEICSSVGCLTNICWALLQPDRYT